MHALDRDRLWHRWAVGVDVVHEPRRSVTVVRVRAVEGDVQFRECVTECLHCGKQAAVSGAKLVVFGKPIRGQVKGTRFVNKIARQNEAKAAAFYVGHVVFPDDLLVSWIHRGYCDQITDRQKVEDAHQTEIVQLNVQLNC